MDQLRRIAGFAAVSGLGLAMDFVLFLALVAGGASPFAANAVSGGVAVAFVYFASVRRIFSYRGSFLLGLFCAYLVYQLAGVSLASLAVGFLAEHSLPAAAAKVAILPVTFSCNYAFMAWLTRRGRLADTPLRDSSALAQGLVR